MFILLISAISVSHISFIDSLFNAMGEIESLDSVEYTFDINDPGIDFNEDTLYFKPENALPAITLPYNKNINVIIASLSDNVDYGNNNLINEPYEFTFSVFERKGPVATVLEPLANTISSNPQQNLYIDIECKK